MKNRPNSLLSIGLLTCMFGCSDPGFVERTENKSPVLKKLDPKLSTKKGSDQAGIDGENDSILNKGNDSKSNSSDAEKSENPLILKVADRVKFEKKIDQIAVKDQLTFAMTGMPYTGKTLMKQSAPSLGTFEINQGNDVPALTESFAQSEIGVLDILMVIDDSGSMKEEQELLSTRLSPLITSIARSNWQIGVITSDASRSYLRGLIRKSDMNAATLFRNAVEAGTGGNGNEQSVYQSVFGLSANLEGAQGTWLREGSSVAVVIVSDEDNCSRAATTLVNGVTVLVGEGCRQVASSKAKYVLDNLPLGRQAKKDFKVHGLFSVPGKSCPTAENVGRILQELVTLTGGTSGSICDQDYTGTLESISAGIATQLKSQFVLKQTPMGGVIQSISINGSTLTGGYKITGNIVEFNENSLPASGSTIEVRYQPSNTSIFNSFVVASAPDNVLVNVAVNNIPLAASDFSFNPATKIVSFGSQKTPPAGANIKVSWQKIELNKTFLFEEALAVDSLSVQLEDGKKLNATYIASSKSLDFELPPPAGSIFEVNWQGKKGKKLSYFIGSQVNLIKSAELPSGAKLSFVIDQENIVFKETDIIPGKNIVLNLEKQGLPSEVPLDLKAIADSIMVKVDGKKCESFSRNAAGGIIIDSQMCSMNSKSLVVVEYEMPAAQ